MDPRYLIAMAIDTVEVAMICLARSLQTFTMSTTLHIVHNHASQREQTKILITIYGGEGEESLTHVHAVSIF